jgi:hypothetical protein
LTTNLFILVSFNNQIDIGVKPEETELSENEVVKNAARNALRMMRDAGFQITDKITVQVDPDLPFMGYSTQRASGHVIVVAGRAVESGPLEGLIIHEMCHIYRTETKHPSHNIKLLNNVGHIVIHVNDLAKGYQQQLIQQAVNHIQDLYADDISFKVFKKGNAFTDEQASNFFLDWINDAPIPEKTTKDRWLNVGTMLNNCFALSNLKRHNIPDIDQQAQKKVQEFLSQTDEAMQREFTYFAEYMINLKEDVTDKQFEKDLTEYLDRIIKLAGKKA